MIRPHDSIIVQTLGRFLIPVVQIFGLYVLFFGQYGPGGGFVGGVILGTGMILSVLIFGHDASRSQIAKDILHGDGVGMLIYAGVGGLCMIGGGEFLNYSSLSIPGLEEASRRSLGIVLTQIGVAVDVAVTAVSIVFSLSAEEIMEELQISRGNANMNIRALIDWGLVFKELKPGERKEFFVAEKDMWEVVKNIIIQRKKRELEPMLRVLDEISSVDPESEEAEEFVEIIREIKLFSNKADSTLDTLVKSDSNWFVGTFMKMIK